MRYACFYISTWPFTSRIDQIPKQNFVLRSIIIGLILLTRAKPKLFILDGWFIYEIGPFWSQQADGNHEKQE